MENEFFYEFNCIEDGEWISEKVTLEDRLVQTGVPIAISTWGNTYTRRSVLWFPTADSRQPFLIVLGRRELRFPTPLWSNLPVAPLLPKRYCL